MKVLWVINIPLPEASRLMGEKPSPFGGWLINASKNLSVVENVDLSIAFPSSRGGKIERLEGQNIDYYSFVPIKEKNYKKIKKNDFFEELLINLKPDVVHVYGTELSHTLSMINACNKLNIKSVISIQGLVSVIEKHMYSNLPLSAIYGMTLRNLARKDNVHGLKKQFKNRGKNEVEALKKSSNIIGRTTWDKACSYQINADAKYHFCNETLRDEFYEHQWSLEKCKKHSIFLSQGSYSIKGLHVMLEALPIILKEYPDATVYVGGKDITKETTVKERLLITYYGKYIKKMIKKFKLEGKVIFTGPLDEKQMCQQFLKSHIFVSPSSIENSPNSLGEAMILGIPSIASYVGGTPDMLKHMKEGFLYQADAPYMLAYYICEIFKDDELALIFSDNARKRALVTHNKTNNTNTLVDIYNKIRGEN